VSLELKGVMQNDGDFLEVILLKASTGYQSGRSDKLSGYDNVRLYVSGIARSVSKVSNANIMYRMQI
jgi:hypothetical protein